MGYPQSGLEIWGYPFQILSGYQVGFRQVGAAAEVEGRLLLRRVDYQMDSITRTYIGPDYLVREKLFVPLDQPAAVISYEVEGSRKIDIVVHFVPVLDLMWPGATGGQYSRWNGDAPGFVIAEPEREFSAVVGSPEIVAHDDTVNSTVRAESRLSFALRPRSGSSAAAATANVFVVLNPAKAKDPAASLHTLSADLRQLRSAAAANVEALQSSSLRIHTPDETVNRDLAWAEAALDQAWVCSPLLGCGIVAGYGPSRDARRPQYAWFFAGDGLVATNALISAGEYTRAREELAFIQRYQDPVTGMIWHELSQSAGYIDWSKYPYMYVHVDISFDYLATVARYVAISGDAAFAQEQWKSIASAYRYCQSLIGRDDHLPHIPQDKEASDEQHRPADDLGLSAAWIDAASGFAELAGVTGHTQQIEPALEQADLTRRSIPLHYWNSARNFWLDGHTHGGEPIFRQALGPTKLVVQHVFSAQQNAVLLDQLASADFQTDWGSREVASTASDYDPYSYGAGSVSALGTSAVATTFWQAHRPESAFALWNAVMQWNSLDSLGHLHEVLAGNFYHEQTESVPEQTWSSAGLVDATVRGLFGLEVDGLHNRLRLAPHLPAEWEQVSVENIRLPHSLLAVTLTHSITSLDLDISNEGPATSMSFEPEIPLGAHLLAANYEGRVIDAPVEASPGDAHAKMTLDVPSGVSHCRLSFEGGVSISLPRPILRVGDPSSNLKLISLHLSGNVLSIDADVPTYGSSTLSILTPWKIIAQQGATVHSLRPNEYRIEIAQDLSEARPLHPAAYTHAQAVLTFGPPDQSPSAPAHQSSPR